MNPRTVTVTAAGATETLTVHEEDGTFDLLDTQGRQVGWGLTLDDAIAEAEDALTYEAAIAEAKGVLTYDAYKARGWRVAR